MVYLFYTTYISVGIAYHEILRAKFCKVGISTNLTLVAVCHFVL